MTDWGQSRALVYALRREIKRLGQANERLQVDRTELLAILTRVADRRFRARPRREGSSGARRAVAARAAQPPRSRRKITGAKWNCAVSNPD